MNPKALIDGIGIPSEEQQWKPESQTANLRLTRFTPTSDSVDRESLVNWWLNVYSPKTSAADEIPFEVYITWNQGVWHQFKYVLVDGYNSALGQSAIKVACVKFDHLEPQLAELLQWLPSIKESRLPELDLPCKRIGIFESVSEEEDSKYELMVFNDGQACVGKRVSGVFKHLNQFKTLRDAMGFIREFLWYAETNEEE